MFQITKSSMSLSSFRSFYVPRKSVGACLGLVAAMVVALTFTESLLTG